MTFRFADPPALAWLAAVAAVALAGALALLRGRRLLGRAYGPQARRVAPAAGAARPAARLALSCGGLALLAIALARPEVARPAATSVRGLDLAVALDASRSMLATDVAPSRLARAKLDIAALAGRLAGDRLALVAFAGTALVQSPLAVDEAAFRLLLEAVEPAAMPVPGTALAAALDAARRSLGAGVPGRARAIVLVTDGEDHEGGAEAAARRLAAEGIALVVAGVGTPEGAVVPAVDRGRAPAVVSRLDEAALRRVAEAGGGTYVRAAASPDGFVEVERALAGLARSEIAMRGAARWHDAAAWALAPAFALLLAGTLVPPARRRAGGRA